MAIDALKSVIGSALDVLVTLYKARSEDSPGGKRIVFMREMLPSLGIVFDAPDILDNALAIPGEVWGNGDDLGITDAELDELVTYVEVNLPSDMQGKARNLTLILLKWMGQTVQAARSVQAELLPEDDTASV